MSDLYVLGLDAIDRTQIPRVGGKAAGLGELLRIDGVSVPSGFCVTTNAFRRIIAQVPSVDERLVRLSALQLDDREAIAMHSAEIRRAIEAIDVPDDVAASVADELALLGEQEAYAVRSSATSEDLPTASFAGQHDTFLNVVGPTAIVQRITQCWASLFSERAVTYRLSNGFDHRAVHMAVVVQRMVVPHAAGIVFTADPVTSNRTVASVEAAFGLGEAVVSGLVNPDVYTVREAAIVSRLIASKQRAIDAAPGGGTQQRAVESEKQRQPALTDEQVVRLTQLCRRIEAHFGRPQDIEWCLVDDGFQIVQSRAITTLFPIPAMDDEEHHVFVSVGHQQMMTDPMKPLGLSLFQLTALPRMYEAAGRLFVDVTARLASPATSAGLLEMLGKSDPLIGDALQTILDRDFIRAVPDERPAGATGGSPAGVPAAPIEPDRAVVAELVASTRASIDAMQRAIRTLSGSALLDFILDDIQELKRILFDPRSHQVFIGAMEASSWLNEHVLSWLGEANVADTLTQSVRDNVTSEMGLELMDVADSIRPHPEVVAFLQRVVDRGVAVGGADDENFLGELATLAGGGDARDAIAAFLDRYGMRCVGEIDITRPRWTERPTALVPIILGNIKNFESGAGPRRFELGRQEAWQKEQEVLERLRALPGGHRRAEEAKRMIDRVRTFIGYREYPKYGMVCRYFVYKQALLEEADHLVRAGVIRTREDIYFLGFEELRDVVRTNQVDDRLIQQRRDAFRSYQKLTPPRVLTSEGEAVAGVYRRGNLPAEALLGLAVSTGTVEGRARVILDIANADLERGDILVTAFTDPSWTPLFVAIAGLVTEVGGLMTHGAVIAREYGVPAVVGVQHATRLIRDGQRIRVHGTDGYVEILP